VSGRAQQGILGGVDVTGTSVPEYSELDATDLGADLGAGLMICCDGGDETCKR